MAWIIVPVLAALAAAAATFAVAMRKGLFLLQREVDEAWREFELQLGKRQQHVTAVVALCAGLMHHEREILERVTETGRNTLAAAARRNLQALAAAEKAQHAAVTTLVDQSGNYPQFARSSAFGALVDRLAILDERVAFRRERYNAAAGILNLRCNAFPSRWVALLSGHARAEFLVEA